MIKSITRVPLGRTMTASPRTQINEGNYADSVIVDKSKRTLNDLLRGFHQIFPRSEWENLKIADVKIGGLHMPILRVDAVVMSSKDPRRGYRCNIVLRRDLEATQRWNGQHKCEVRCSCPAFNYWMANPDLTSKNFHGNPTAWNKVRNKVRNPRLIPGICKHLVQLSYSLNNSGTVKL
jgi:hypothetical protein